VHELFWKKGDGWRHSSLLLFLRASGLCSSFLIRQLQYSLPIKTGLGTTKQRRKSAYAGSTLANQRSLIVLQEPQAEEMIQGWQECVRMFTMHMRLLTTVSRIRSPSISRITSGSLHGHFAPDAQKKSSTVNPSRFACSSFRFKKESILPRRE